MQSLFCALLFNLLRYNQCETLYKFAFDINATTCIKHEPYTVYVVKVFGTLYLSESLTLCKNQTVKITQPIIIEPA